jgi:enamine deaminase RidA (YjgF/YER057c/UK114 family)
VNITHINPDALHKNPAFSQGVLAEGGRTLYIGEQNGTDATGAITGDYADQTRQALRNILAVLAEVGADQSNVVKMTIYIAAGQDPNAGYAASAEVWGYNATAVTVLIVSALGRPEALVGIEAIASV